ncbi:hypothetical protein K432DRAFT_380213 [Lepidopterella palustris CBS 459.81]|uniref:Uncharacterized protein n=1 Tax=Lepidopterella palustris CBS 459.81 TaxID=1314670 RepID=A0A8E2EEQ1_9PEZI|nr:hypothetical protein K432DRAFT_380213 [Lepidopterella palustris CBS 459.81]
MHQYIPTPVPRDLLHPLLACLPTAFVSSKPPPALLSLLSPILRQRVSLLSSESWLPLLCWDTYAASKLPEIVSRIQLEPHPVSGEIELRDPEAIQFRRLDPETLHARLVLDEFGLLPTYLWCTGEEGNAWRLAELRGIEDGEDGTQWFETMSEADEEAGPGFRRKPSSVSAPHTNGATNGHNGSTVMVTATQTQSKDEDEDDDDDYWASYDRTPGRTPAKRSPAPRPNIPSSIQLPSQSELEYFARYAAEVQPALDAHDPDEEAAAAAGESTLNGDTLSALHRRREPETEPLENTDLDPMGYDFSFPPPAPPATNGLNGLCQDSGGDEKAALNHPRPSSSASSGSVERLEREAESHSQAEVAIKQHISTDLKSLFRLARSAGIESEEFERIVKRELEVLPLLEMDR